MKWTTSFRSDRYEFEILKEAWQEKVTGGTHNFYTFYAHDNQGKDDRDYQQDDLDMAKRSANHHFNIPLESWQQVD